MSIIQIFNMNIILYSNIMLSMNKNKYINKFGKIKTNNMKIIEQKKQNIIDNKLKTNKISNN